MNSLGGPAKLWTPSAPARSRSPSAGNTLKEAPQAHRDLEGRKTVGSVVLTP